MAGINPNLGNLKLQNLQLSKTAEVDTQKAEDKGVGDAKPAAVWINNNERDYWGPDGHCIGWDANVIKPGDVMFIDGTAIRLCVNPDGKKYWAETTVLETDFESHRGDVRRQ